MEEENGTASKTSSSSSSSTEKSVTSYKKKKKPCGVCGSNANDDKIMTCFTCKVTREHTYCAWVPLSSVPPLWQCQVCHDSFIIVISSETASSGRPAHTNQDSVSSRSSHVDGQNTGGQHSIDDETSATNQPLESKAHTSPVASSPMSTNTSPDQKQSSDSSNTVSDSESAK